MHRTVVLLLVGRSAWLVRPGVGCAWLLRCSLEGCCFRFADWNSALAGRSAFGLNMSPLRTSRTVVVRLSERGVDLRVALCGPCTSKFDISGSVCPIRLKFGQCVGLVEDYNRLFGSPSIYLILVEKRLVEFVRSFVRDDGPWETPEVLRYTVFH